MLDSDIVDLETLNKINNGSVKRPVFRGPYFILNEEVAIPPPKDLCISKEKIGKSYEGMYEGMEQEAILADELVEEAWSSVGAGLIKFVEGYKPAPPEFVLPEGQLRHYILSLTRNFKLKRLPLKVEGVLGIKLTSEKTVEPTITYTVSKIWINAHSGLSWAVDIKLPEWLAAEKFEKMLEGSVVKLGGEGGAVRLKVLSKPRLRGLLEEVYRSLKSKNNSLLKVITLSHTPISIGKQVLPAGHGLVEKMLGVRMLDAIKAKLITIEPLGGFDLYATFKKGKIYRKPPETMLLPGSLYWLQTSQSLRPEDLLSFYDEGIADTERQWRLGASFIATVRQAEY